MGGGSVSSVKLNRVLLTIAKLLNAHNVTNWFIGYGTLLGIVRNESCINGDDDVDIIANCKDTSVIIKILSENGFQIDNRFTRKNFFRTKETSEFGPVDFYMANVDTNTGNFKDTWENVMWSSCYSKDKLIELEWNGSILYLPNNYETKLLNRYGSSWKTPQNTKGPQPRKAIL